MTFASFRGIWADVKELKFSYYSKGVVQGSKVYGLGFREPGFRMYPYSIISTDQNIARQILVSLPSHIYQYQ